MFKLLTWIMAERAAAGELALPPNLKGKLHTDFPKGLQWVPRSWTAFSWGAPRMVAGNIWIDAYLNPPKPITAPGTWQISRFPYDPWWAWYFAFTTKGGTHFRIGARWDNVDNYVEWPTIAIKRGIK